MIDQSGDVSVVVLTHNRRELLAENLAALRRSALRPLEIIVVNNNSSDGTSGFVRSAFPEARLVEVGYDSGVEGFNIGIRAAAGEFVAVTDDDSELPPDCLGLMREKFRSEPPDTAIITPKIVEPGMPEELLSSPATNIERYVDLFEGSTFMARRKLLVDKNLLFPKEFFIYGNERDVSARMANVGLRIKYLPSARSLHKKPYGVRLGRKNLYLTARNYTWLLLKYYSAGDILKTLWYMAANALRPREDHFSMGMDTRASEGFRRIFRPGDMCYALLGFLEALARADYWLRNRRVVTKKGFGLLYDTWRLK
jgi:GT2 family glycosyltransferase